MSDEIKEILEDLRNKNMSVDDLTHNDKTKLLDYITNLQEENKKLKDYYNDNVNNYEELLEKYSTIQILYNSSKLKNDKAIEYITSYESIFTIQGLDKIEQNKTLDEKTIIVMVNRYLEVHDKLLNILQNGGDK